MRVKTFQYYTENIWNFYEYIFNNWMTGKTRQKKLIQFSKSKMASVCYGPNFLLKYLIIGCKLIWMVYLVRCSFPYFPDFWTVLSFLYILVNLTSQVDETSLIKYLFFLKNSVLVFDIAYWRHTEVYLAYCKDTYSKVGQARFSRMDYVWLRRVTFIFRKEACPWRLASSCSAKKKLLR